MRKRISLVVFAVVLAAAIPAITSARTAKPAIQTTEAGYFGNALTTRSITVIVYSNVGPSAGNHVKVCFAGHCKQASGHDGSTAWYSATFGTQTLTMSDHVSFTATASDSAGRAKVHATKQVICIKGDGSTPQG
jgi:hypothetical protein